MTLQEAFDAHTKGKDKALINNFKATLRDLEKAGFPPSTPVSQLNTEKSITDLQKWTTTERFKKVSSGSGMFASRVKTLINVGIGPEQTNVLSNYEKANRGKPTEFGIRLTRAARKLELPAFDDFNAAIDATARQLTDKEAKAFFMIKTLTGLRNPDILKLQVGNAVEGAKYGSFDPEVKKLYNLSNKGDRINYDLGEIVHGILGDLAADAQAAGRTELFTQSEEKIRSTINPVMRSNMTSMGLEIRDLNKNAAVDFSVRDLRKNIFDILEEEIGAADANKVLGHSDKADVGLNHYKVERKSRRSLSRLQSAQEIFSNLYMESVGFDSPQTLFGSDGYGFANDNFKPTTVVPLVVDAPAEQQTVESKTRTATAQASGAVDRSVDSLENKIKKLEGLVGQVQNLTEQTEGLVPVDDKAAAKTQKTIDAGKESISSMITNFGRKITDPNKLGAVAKGSIDVGGKVIKGLLPVAVGTSTIAATREAEAQGASPFSAAMQGLAAGASEVVAPPGMAYSDAPFREEQRTTRPAESGLGPRTDVAPQMDAMGYIKPEFAPYPMEDAPAPNIPDPAPPAPDMAAQGFVPVPEARANAMRGETTAMEQAPSFLYGGVVR